MYQHLIPISIRTLLFATVTAALLAACQKCETCSYSYTTDQGERETYTFPEVCGEAFKREAQESACQTAAQLAGTTCTCSKS